MTTQTTIQPQRLPDPDEINLLEYVYAIIRNKWIILLITLAGLGTGYYLAIKKGPVYIADAVIAPREVENQSTPSLSGLGIFGGMVASQLNISGNASLEKINLILDSRSFHAEIVEKKLLLPLLFSKSWDTVSNTWQEQFKPPEPIVAGGMAKTLLKTEMQKNGTLLLKITTKDSLNSYKILSAYLEYLDQFIRTGIQKDAKENRDYLEQQMISIIDPLIRTKLQELIAKEVEKMMVVSKEAFRILDNPLVVKSYKEKRLFPLIGGGAAFFMITFLVIIVHAFGSSPKTDEDKLLINRIKAELFRLPLFKSR